MFCPFVYQFAHLLNIWISLQKMEQTEASKHLNREIIMMILTIRWNAYSDPILGKQWSWLHWSFNDLTLVTGNCFLQSIVYEIRLFNMPSDTTGFERKYWNIFMLTAVFPLRLSELIMGLWPICMLSERSYKVQIWTCYYFFNASSAPSLQD